MGGRCQVCGTEYEHSVVTGESGSRCAACHAQVSNVDYEEPTGGENVHPDAQATFETHSVSDADPDFITPDSGEGPAGAEPSPVEPRYSQFEHEDWMTDLRSLAAQSTAMNTNNRPDSISEIAPLQNGELWMRTPSMVPLAAPLEIPALTARVAEATPAAAAPGPSGRSHARMLAWLAGGAAFVAMAAFAAYATMQRPMVLKRHELGRMFQSPAVTHAPQAAPRPGSAGNVRRAVPSREGATAMSPMLQESPASAAQARGSERSPSADPAAPPGAKGDRPLGAESVASPAADAVAAPPPEPSSQTLAEAIERAAGTKPAPAAAAAAPEPAPRPEGDSFNRAAALSALRSISGSLSSCKSDSKGSGKGAVRVTFAPSGKATNAVVEGGPFAGTPAGSCVARRFREARVPPFSGGPVTVRQGFTVR